MHCFVKFTTADIVQLQCLVCAKFIVLVVIMLATALINHIYLLNSGKASNVRELTRRQGDKMLSGKMFIANFMFGAILVDCCGPVLMILLLMKLFCEHFLWNVHLHL